METLDLAALDTTKGAEAGFELQLTSPKGEPLPLWITVLGSDSDTYERILNEQQRGFRDKLGRNRRAMPTREEVFENTLDLLAGATRSWRADLTLDGQPWPAFSPATAKVLYRRFKWMREQVDSAVHERANFIPASATT